VAAGEAVWQAFQQNPSEFAPLGGVLPAWRQAEQEFSRGRYLPAAIKGTESIASGLVDVLTGGAAAPIKAAAIATSKTLAPSLAAILAYHATPHAFKKFDMGKFGTGEGAAAYGHGLYFAGAKGTGKTYKDKFTRRAATPDDSPDVAAAFAVQRIGEKSALRNEVRLRDRWNPGHPKYERHDAILKAIESGAYKNADVPKANLYKVKLSPDEHELLDWFEPLSKQSDQVQAGVKKAFEDAGIPNAAKADTDGQSIYTWLASAMGRGENVPDSVLKQRASAALEKAGIPGIKYRDQLSRGRSLDDLVAGRQNRIDTIADIRKRPPSERNSAMIAEKNRHIAEYDKLIADYKPQTSNYVIFDDSLLEIVGKE
jgi:hypothetical protein